MTASFSSIPWNTHALWREANTSLAHAMRQNHLAIAESRWQANRIQHQLESTFPLMDRLCRETCPGCKDVCCQRAWVWADFRDLLFLHLAGIPVPKHQLLTRQGDHCRYGSPEGCRLHRIQRPFVCTWYLCPAQTRILKKQPAEKHNLSRILEQIKNNRKRMEASYIQAVS